MVYILKFYYFTEKKNTVTPSSQKISFLQCIWNNFFKLSDSNLQYLTYSNINWITYFADIQQVFVVNWEPPEASKTLSALTASVSSVWWLITLFSRCERPKVVKTSNKSSMIFSTFWLSCETSAFCSFVNLTHHYADRFFYLSVRDSVSPPDTRFIQSTHHFHLESFSHGAVLKGSSSHSTIKSQKVYLARRSRCLFGKMDISWTQSSCHTTKQSHLRASEDLQKCQPPQEDLPADKRW